MTPLFRLTNALLTTVTLLSACLAEKLALRNVIQERKLSLDPIEQYHFLPPVQTSHGNGANEELELLDICLVASVDGKFHALNRSSGQVLWSMGASTGTEFPSALAPLIRTQHVDPDPVHDGSESKELYIIEPQSGDIYVLPKEDEPLQRLPFSMTQLVDMSPFYFSGDDEHRVFVGKKQTSLLILELEIGRLKGTINADSECPWDPFGDLDKEQQSSAEVDLDELDGTKPPKVMPVSTEILIGRTDYHVSIQTRPRNPSEPRPPVQNLTFSTYGPNNQDLPMQATYRRTPDDTYIQSTAAGEIMSFRTSSERSDSLPIWGMTFKSPIVAVFDILQAPDRQSPMALLQPQPRLQDFIPNFSSGSNLDVGQTYIGMISENRALYALSPAHFPLAVFAPDNYRFVEKKRLRTIDAPPGYMPEPGDGGRDFPLSVDDVTRLLKDRARCANGKWDRSCVVGARPVAAADQSRLSRLLPDRPYEPEAPKVHDNPPQFGSGSLGNESQLVHENEQIGDGLARQARAFGGSVMALVIFFLGIYYLSRKARNGREGEKTSISSSGSFKQDEPFERLNELAEGGVKVVDFAESKPLPALPELASDGPVSPPSTNSDDFVIVPPAQIPAISEMLPSSKPKAAEAIGDGDGDDDSGHEGDNAAVPGRKKVTRRRKRGKKNKGNAVVNGADDEGENNCEENVAQEGPTLTAPPLTPSPSMRGSQSQQLVVSDEVLGYGSHGTVVYRGSLQGRPVAVKRLLQDFVTLASREVMILQESDDHPNVIRYYYQESHANFLYIALELCPASLADVIEHPDLHRELSNAFDPKRALQQIASGMRHLHALKIVHRDIKPQNILISSAKRGAGAMAGHRMLISDFGLCKRLEVDQTSFLPTAHGAGAAGTVGWRAPEILRGDVNLDEPTVDDSTQSSRGSSVGTATNGTVPKPTRLTKAVDIFALGCLFYYILTSGGHPFGDRYEREANILKDTKSLSALESFGEEGLEAIDLISFMLDPDPSKRPDTSTCLTHPFFWNAARRLAFLQDASDRFEIMCRDPRDPDLIELEKGAYRVVGNDWQSRLDKVFLDNLGKFRKYDGKSVQDLMRALRNKKHHYQDLPDNVKRHLGPLPDGFLSYFTRRFPQLFMHVHSVISRTNLRYESMFRSYFELSD
ncbi:uncharacterized protein FOMMEDRAFT_109089 [Fomitiporia mediterranea MF3/22]|uniref:uncharacterized protein n=1 Tax=Fomitiporia mediterranea (strain MF3/22) TaxID=694068 RepID=UPI00044079BD|nr:uncharacterized protein FOMMEDRAFT_109089 [Fomitiporia mediterranea MF3/22]EJD02004.1 hypothetical protein FOMMEDRAFT_109089 [Fomitiporia mediterranea MF3/22]